MGQLIDEEDCEVCVPFDQEWIFTYGDLVTLLLCFFILLFASCVYETKKFKAVAESFKPLSPGSPFMQEGRDYVVDQIAKEVEQTELGDDTRVTVEEKGVVTFQRILTIQSAGEVRNLWFRAASGKVQAQGNGSYRIDDSILLSFGLSPGCRAVVRDAGGKQDLLVSVSLKNGKARIEEKISW